MSVPRPTVSADAYGLDRRRRMKGNRMADVDETRNLLLEAINSLARVAADTSRGATALTAAGGAAKDLAEAHAWLGAPNNAH